MTVQPANLSNYPTELLRLYYEYLQRIYNFRRELVLSLIRLNYQLPEGIA